MRSHLLRTLLVWLVFVGITDHGFHALGQSGAAQRAQDRAIKQLEKMLTVPGDGGGFSTWYVLVFFDGVQRISRNLTQSTSRYDVYTVKRELYGAKKVLLVQGRRSAAEALLQYLLSANVALEKMPAIGAPNCGSANKNWDFRAFITEVEAKALYTMLTASSAPSR
jgi:hypothetical protein